MESEQHLTPIFNKNYGDDSKALLLDQYKMYVEMHDRISARRSQMNSFFISLSSGLLALFSISANQGQVIKFPVVGLVVGLVGTLLCILWNFNITAYRRLVERKIKVIHEMEEYLPFYCYTREGTLRKQDMVGKVYIRPTMLERLVSLVFSLVYLGLATYCVFNWK
jgi:hypothetical protein